MILNQQYLANPAAGSSAVRLPRYPRGGAPGVVHLGLGAFHRAHQALVFDDLLEAGDGRWGVLGVGMRSHELADALAAQDGLYAVQISSPTAVTWRVGGALWRTCVAARERDVVTQSIGAASTRWITLSVTEKAYTLELADLIVPGLALRHAAGLGGLTIASCDNLSGNGDKLKAICLTAAQRHSAALAQWVSDACAFPNSMVDRIVPAATPARLAAAAEVLGATDQASLGTEGFWEWVIERHFVDPADGAALASAGVTVVDDVAPFEDAKLQLLNASHSAMACMGAIAGWRVISDCIEQPAVRTFVHGLMTYEVGPQLTRPDWPAYRDALLARFGNLALQHSVHQIATDSSQKIPQRWPPSVLGQQRAGLPFERLAFAAAVWMRYVRGVNESGVVYSLNDPMAETVQTLANTHADDAAATVRALGGLVSIWGTELPKDGVWLGRVTHWLVQINALGVLQALEKLNAELQRP